MSQNILGTVFASLLNSLWQSAAIALLVWTALRFMPRMGVRINAATRCAAWWAVLAALLILPLTPPRADPPQLSLPPGHQAAEPGGVGGMACQFRLVGSGMRHRPARTIAGFK